jgi:hypothetical protein
MGCSVATDATAPEDLARTTHALIQVRHTAKVEGPERADALAGFVRVPLTADPAELLALAGLREALPPEGTCQTELAGSARAPKAPNWKELPEGGVELLPVDDLSLSTEGGDHQLAPRAYPSVSDWISGVVYTSRDQEATTLPTAGTYHIRVLGMDGAFEMDTTHESPPGISAVTVGGVPFADVRTLPFGAPLDLTWSPSENPLDLVAVTLSTSGFTHTCSTSDGEGAASVVLDPLLDPEQPLLARGEPVTLTVRRIRTGASTNEAESFVLEVRFDFAVVADITFE